MIHSWPHRFDVHYGGRYDPLDRDTTGYRECSFIPTVVLETDEECSRIDKVHRRRGQLERIETMVLVTYSARDYVEQKRFELP